MRPLKAMRAGGGKMRKPMRKVAVKRLMDAIRPHAEWTPGAPVIAVVSTLPVAGDVVDAAPDAPVQFLRVIPEICAR